MNRVAGCHSQEWRCCWLTLRLRSAKLRPTSSTLCLGNRLPPSTSPHTTTTTRPLPQKLGAAVKDDAQLYYQGQRPAPLTEGQQQQEAEVPATEQEAMRQQQMDAAEEKRQAEEAAEEEPDAGGDADPEEQQEQPEREQQQDQQDAEEEEQQEEQSGKEAEDAKQRRS